MSTASSINTANEINQAQERLAIQANEHEEKLCKRLGISPPAKEKLLFLDGEYNKLAPYKADPFLTSFILSEKALEQLCKLSLPIRFFVDSTIKRHRCNDRAEREGKPGFRFSKIVNELHFAYGMTLFVSYQLGKPSPIGVALKTLVEIRKSKNKMANISLGSVYDFWIGDEPIFTVGDLIFKCSSDPFYRGAPYIMIDQAGNEVTMEIPNYRSSSASGYAWLWNYHPCCPESANNFQPWRGRVCNCERPY